MTSSSVYLLMLEKTGYQIYVFFALSKENDLMGLFRTLEYLVFCFFFHFFDFLIKENWIIFFHFILFFYFLVKFFVSTLNGITLSSLPSFLPSYFKFPLFPSSIFHFFPLFYLSSHLLSFPSHRAFIPPSYLLSLQLSSLSLSFPSSPFYPLSIFSPFFHSSTFTHSFSYYIFPLYPSFLLRILPFFLLTTHFLLLLLFLASVTSSFVFPLK